MIKSKMMVLLGALVVSGVASADLNTGLVAYYPFDGNANDASLNGNNGTVHGAALVEDRFKNPNSAYYFDGSSYIDLQFNNLPIGGNERTVSALVKLDKLSTGNIISYGTAAEWQTFGVRYSLDEAWLSVAAPWLGLMGYDSGSSGADFSVKAPLKLNNWSMITYTYKDSVLNIYLDGKLLVSHQFPQSHNTGTTSAFIGKSIHACCELPVSGVLDEIRVYSRALSSSEVKSLYYSEFPAVVKGTVNWVTPPYSVKCTNNTTVKSIVISRNKSANYDCEKAGLVTNSNDDIAVTIRGKKH